ncbi:hypothetical protein [Alloalcanivorax mobilis]|uniref:hypothetical protein n=1 Tax=Alloalcanivorax mobilis TaxID=2019569 RepID=UPI000C7746E7|nr:hypothetical protein [Alloalcanivorax mobilis]
MQDPQRLPERVNGDGWLVHRGRFVDTTFLLEVGDQGYLIRILDGRVESVRPGPFVMARWSFAIRVQEEAWAEYCQPYPKPGYHDILAMVKFKTLKLEGDQHPLMANLLYFKDVLVKLRETI